MPKPFQNEAKILEIRVLKNDGERCEKKMAGGIFMRGEGFAPQVGGNCLETTGEDQCQWGKALGKTTGEDHWEGHWGRPLGKTIRENHWGKPRPLGKTTGENYWGKRLGKTTWGDHWGKPLEKTTGENHWGRPLGKTTRENHWGKIGENH